MSALRVYSALNVPTATPQPSISCVQWSGDGQIIITTKNAIYILSPDLGINFDSTSLLQSYPDKRNNVAQDSADTSSELRWHKNVIENDRIIRHNWSTATHEWGSVTLGSLDPSWRTVTISPSNLTTNAGCIIAILNSNLELSIWCANKNHLREAWTKTQDITNALRDHPLPRRNDKPSQGQESYLKSLRAQVNCIAWSQQADFGLRPNPLLDGSILALGNRAGSVVLMRYDGRHSVFFIQDIHISDGWVTHLAWGSWTNHVSGQCDALLSCGVADGSTVLIRVKQKIKRIPALTPFGLNFEIICESDLLSTCRSERDGKGITALRWIDVPGVMLLLCAKPGLLQFFRYTPTLDLSQGTGVTVRLQTQKLSVGSSALNPVAGINFIKNLDTLIITLFDGSFHVVRSVTTVVRPSGDSMDVDDVEIPGLSSKRLSRAARAAFLKAESGSLRHVDVNRIGGSITFDENGTFAWLHEACRPNDFSYKHDAQHNSMFVVARLWDTTPANDYVLSTLMSILDHTGSILHDSPVHVLRPMFLQLRHRHVFDTVCPTLLEYLNVAAAEHEWGTPFQRLTDEITTETRKEFRRSLVTSLFGWESFYSLRLRLAIADFCWEISSDALIREKFGEIAQKLLQAASHRFLAVVSTHLLGILDVCTEKEIPFLMRIVVQSLLTGSPNTLVEKANALNEAIKLKFPSSDAHDLSEPCPACHAPIPLESLLKASCPKGHTWVRCSVTSFILSTPLVRTCIGCTRKSLLAPSSQPSESSGSLMWYPEAAQSWVVNELLESVHRCLYCGNQFVRVL